MTTRQRKLLTGFTSRRIEDLAIRPGFLAFFSASMSSSSSSSAAAGSAFFAGETPSPTGSTSSNLQQESIKPVPRVQLPQSFALNSIKYILIEDIC
uniref:Uncharacterized protein n=1 Tax=Bubo bubo TaxID=30461 RepID=A0A8C0FXX1_BUBBB